MSYLEYINQVNIFNQPVLPTATMWVYNHYKILSDFKAQCKECPKTLCYISTEIFQEHLEDNHLEIIGYEKTWKSQDWKFFRKIDHTENVQCIICDAIVPLDDKTLDHQHSKEERRGFPEGWIYRYLKKTSPYAVACVLCKKILNLEPLPETFSHIKLRHPILWGAGPKLREEQRKTISVDLAIIKGLIDDFLFKYDQMEIGEENDPPTIIHQPAYETWVKENYYLTYSNFQAKCKVCHITFTSVQVKNITYHIFRKHRSIYLLERKQNLPWVNFRYRTRNLEPQCVACDKSFPSIIKGLNNEEGINTHYHNLAQDNSYVHHFKWQSKYAIFKYSTNNFNFRVTCCICHKYLTMTPSQYLRIHIERCHSTIPYWFWKKSQLNNEPAPYDRPSTSRETLHVDVDLTEDTPLTKKPNERSKLKCKSRGSSRSTPYDRSSINRETSHTHEDSSSEDESRPRLRLRPVPRGCSRTTPYKRPSTRHETN